MSEQGEPPEQEAGEPKPERPSGPSPRPSPRIPKPDPKDAERDKRYMRGPPRHGAGRRTRVQRAPEPPLVVTVNDGPVASNYAPAALIGKLAERVALALSHFGGGYQPMLYGAEAGASMRLIFGDADPFYLQERLPIENTVTQGGRIATLMDLEGDALWAQAVHVGPPMRQYTELAQLVQSEGVTLAWSVREDEERIWTPDRARSQHARLTAPVKTRDRQLTVNGTLYRVITESTREGFRGSVGIHLHSWSPRPPRVKRRAHMLAYYENEEIENRIREGLVGNSVEAGLLIRHALPGGSIEPETFAVIVDKLRLGPPENPLLGSSILDELAADDDDDDDPHRPWTD